jgi:hypothetical protein
MNTSVDIGGSDDGVQDAILAHRPIFLANRRTDLDQMRSTLAAEDFEGLRKVAHNCKGIGTGYGFPEISEMGAAIVEAARARDGVKSQQFLGRFEEILQEAAKKNMTKLLMKT